MVSMAIRAAKAAVFAATFAAAVPRGAIAAGVAEGTIPVSTSSDAARAAFERGLVAADHSRDADAAQEFHAALDADPGFRLARAFLGEVTPGAPGLADLAQAAEGDAALPPAERVLIDHLLAARRDEPQALALAQKLTQVAPEDWRSHHLLSRYLDAQGDHAAAAEAARRAVALAPGSGAAWNQLGSTLTRKGEAREALEAFRKVAELDAQEPSARDSLGESLMLLGRLDQAEAAFSKATQLSPGFYRGWEGVAYCNFSRGFYDSGRAAITRAIENARRDEEKLDLYRLFAWSFLSAGDGGTALALLAPLEQAQARSWQAAQDRGTFLIETGRATAGLEALQLAWKRADQAGLEGEQRSVLDREGNAVRLLGELAAEKPREAEKTAVRLAQLGQGRRSRAWASALAFARGQLLLAGGNAAGALKILAGCVAEDALCRRAQLRALSLANPERAAQARAAFLREARRTPLDLYVRAQLSRAAAPR